MVEVITELDWYCVESIPSPSTEQHQIVDSTYVQHLVAEATRQY